MEQENTNKIAKESLIIETLNQFRQLITEDVLEGTLKLIHVCEQQKKRPVCVLEIAQTLMHFQQKDIEPVKVSAIVGKLFVQDKLYANQKVSFYSLKQHEGMKKFSDFMSQIPGHTFNSELFQIFPQEGTQLADEHEIFDILRTKYEGNEHLASNLQKPEKFLKEGGLNEVKIAFATFPRSGNAFLKKYLQEVTNLVAGGDFQLPVTWRLTLLLNGLLGSGQHGDNIWLTLSHHPISSLGRKYNAQMILTTVRNPLDIINSFIQMWYTATFELQLAGDYQNTLKEVWELMTLDYCQMYVDYHLKLMKECKDKNVPIYIARYEDLLDNLEPELIKIFEYLLGLDNLEGTFAQKRIQEIVQQNNEINCYKRKYQTFNANAFRFSADIIQKIKMIMKPLLIYFGYLKNPKSDKKCSQFDFFQFSEDEITEEELNNYCGFLELNQENRKLSIDHRTDLKNHFIEINGESCNILAKYDMPKGFREQYSKLQIQLPQDIQLIADNFNEV